LLLREQKLLRGSIEWRVVNTRVDSALKHALKCTVPDAISRNSCMEC